GSSDHLPRSGMNRNRIVDVRPRVNRGPSRASPLDGGAANVYTKGGEGGVSLAGPPHRKGACGVGVVRPTAGLPRPRGELGRTAMTVRFLAASLGIVAALGLRGGPPDDEPTKPAEARRDGQPAADGKVAEARSDGQPAEDGKAKRTTRPRTEKATFAGGCFWSFEAVFEQVPGVKAVIPGFAGGHVPNPSYQLVCTGTTGHAEVVQVEYDPEVVPYDKLLKVFWAAHDPTTL